MHPVTHAQRRVALRVATAWLLGTFVRMPRATAATAHPRAARGLVRLKISTKGDLLEFSTQQLSCRTGSRVRLQFTNASKYVNFDHNWMLLRPGSYDAVVAAAEKAGAAHDWIPAGHPGIIAATRLVHRGETVAVEFDSPAAGRYPYICSVPGHAASMWGVLTVTDR
jgi:azurin